MISFGQKAPLVKPGSDETTSQELRLLQSNLAAMARQVTRFYHAASLFDYCALNARFADANLERSMVERFFSWKLIAARDAVLSVVDFEVALQGANGSLANLKAERKSGPSAFALLNEHFPERAPLRNAAAHTTTSTKDAQKMKDHGSDNDYAGPGISVTNSKGTIIVDALENRRFTTTFDDKIVHMEITGETCSKLEQVKVAFYAILPDSLLDSRQ